MFKFIFAILGYLWNFWILWLLKGVIVMLRHENLIQGHTLFIVEKFQKSVVTIFFIDN